MRLRTLLRSTAEGLIAVMLALLALYFAFLIWFAFYEF